MKFLKTMLTFNAGEILLISYISYSNNLNFLITNNCNKIITIFFFIFDIDEFPTHRFKDKIISPEEPLKIVGEYLKEEIDNIHEEMTNVENILKQFNFSDN